MCQRGHSVMA